jgi:S-adenosylmethionine hydrolase
MKPGKIITLTTDFGQLDSYVGTMKGVILQIAPSAILVDISHQVPAGDIDEAAFLLRGAVPYFAPGSVHLAVVDPGVGTGRRPLVVQSKTQFFVGPDNGIFSDFLHDDARAYHLNRERFFLDRISNTFHGRDIFAPAAAHLCRGIEPQEMGDPVHDPVRIERAGPEIKKGRIIGKVIHIDRFGNLVTNIPEELLPKNPVIRIAGREIKGLSSAYSAGKKAKPIAIIGSSCLLEISVPNEHAARKLKVRKGQIVQVLT